jgi:hypothetical protein
VRHQNAVFQGVLMRVFDDSLCGVRQITSHGICVCRICVHEISTLPKARLDFATICPLDGVNGDLERSLRVDREPACWVFNNPMRRAT